MSADLKFYRWILLAGVWIVYCCFGMITVSMAPLIPAIGSDLNISYGAMGAVLGAWPLIYMASAIPCGILLDKLGAREALAIGIAFVAVSCLLRGLAPNQLTLFLAVAVFGLGGPLISIGAPKYVSKWFEGQHRGFAIGICATGPMLGVAISYAITPSWLMPLTGGNWRYVMFVFAGMVFLTGAVWWLIASHSFARDAGDISYENPRFSLGDTIQMVSNPAVIAVVFMGAGVFFVNHSIINWLPVILRAKGLTLEDAGMLASVATVFGILGLLIVPRLATPPRRRLILILIFTAQVAAALLLLSPSLLIVPWALLALNVARASATAVVMLVLLETPGVDPRNLGLLGGIYFVGAEIGGVLGPLSFGLLSSEDGGFDYSLMSLAGVCASLALLSLVLAHMSKRAVQA